MTSSNNLYRQPYLKLQWKFPTEEAKDLSSQIDKAYIDIAIKVNDRTIGIFSQNYPVATGEKWNLNGYTAPLQTLRKLFVFGPVTHNSTESQPTGIKNPLYFTRIYGTALVDDGTTWIPLQFAASASSNKTISLYVEDIAGVQNVTIDSGTTADDLLSAYVVLEWLSEI